jgi:hypothetical protein
MPFSGVRRAYSRGIVLAAAVIISVPLHAQNEIAGGGAGASDSQESSSLHWYRGNTHTHTSAFPGSDANASPEFAASWYRAHGYQFLVITDHEHFTDATKVPAVENGKFLVMQGQEVTQMVADPDFEGGVRQLHVNGIHTDRLILPIRPANPPARAPKLADGTVDLRPLAAQGVTPAEAYLRNVDAIRAAGGIPQVNHPNLGWSVRLEDLLLIQGPYLLEIWNAYRTSNNLGGTDSAGRHSPSAERLWDELLSKGRVVWGVAADDTHEYQKPDDPMAPSPGKGWVVVRAASLTPGAIASALLHGRFYASTGVTLDTYEASQTGITLSVVRPQDWSPSLPTTTRYTFQFFGQNGRVLKEAYGTSASYNFDAHDQYVRVSIVDSDGRRAWTQPVFLDGRDKAQ